MKKQIHLPAVGMRLNLNKKTISNLDPFQMKNLVGGNATNGAFCNTRKCTDRCYPTHGNCNTWTCGRECIG